MGPHRKHPDHDVDPRGSFFSSLLGRRVRITPLDQFHRAGGSAACLVAPVVDYSTAQRARKAA